MRRIALILGVVWGFASLAPWWAGRRIESEHRAFLAEADMGPFLRVASRSYERGWFTTKAVTVVEPVRAEGDVDAEEPIVRFRFDHEIGHGPYPTAWLRAAGFDGSPIAAHVETRPRIEIETADAVEEIELPMVSNARLARDGSGALRITPDPEWAAFEDPELDADWEDTFAELTFTPDRAHLDGTIEVPRIEFDGEVGTLRVSDLRYRFAYDRVGEVLNQPLYTGGSHFQLGSVVAEVGGERFELRDLDFQDSSDQRAGAWSLEVNGSLGSLAGGDVRIGPAELDYRMDGLALESLARIGEIAADLEDDAIDPDLVKAQMMGVVGQVWPTLMAAEPEFEISRFRLVTQTGEIRMSLRVGVDASEPAMLQHPLTTMPALEVDAQLSLPEALVSGWLAQPPALEALVAPPSPDAAGPPPWLAAAAGAQQGIQMSLQRGWIQERGDRYVTQLRMRKGALRVNGRVVSLDSP